MAETSREPTLLFAAADFRWPNGRQPMKAPAYLLGARALDAAREAEPGIRWPKPEEPLGPIATTEATARPRGRGSAVLHGACLDLGGEGLPYLPVVEALRALARETPPDRLRVLIGPALPDLATLLPDLLASDRGGEQQAEAHPALD